MGSQKDNRGIANGWLLVQRRLHTFICTLMAPGAKGMRRRCEGDAKEVEYIYLYLVRRGCLKGWKGVRRKCKGGRGGMQRGCLPLSVRYLVRVVCEGGSKGMQRGCKGDAKGGAEWLYGGAKEAAYL